MPHRRFAKSQIGPTDCVRCSPPLCCRRPSRSSITGHGQRADARRAGSLLGRVQQLSLPPFPDARRGLVCWLREAGRRESRATRRESAPGSSLYPNMRLLTREEEEKAGFRLASRAPTRQVSTMSRSLPHSLPRTASGVCVEGVSHCEKRLPCLHGVFGPCVFASVLKPLHHEGQKCSLSSISSARPRAQVALSPAAPRGGGAA